MITWYRFWTWIWFRLRIFYLWTSLYRYCKERKWISQALPVMTAIEDVEELMSEIKWTSDRTRWYQSISLPQATYGRHKKGGGGDCDDSAILAATLLERLSWQDPTLGIREVGMLSVLWKGGGHAVCVFKIDGNVYCHNPEIGTMRAYQYAHIGNWNQGRAKRGFASVAGIVLDILNGVGKKQCDCVGWNLVNWRLEHIKTSTCAKL